jgi:hypothetical protein
MLTGCADPWTSVALGYVATASRGDWFAAYQLTTFAEQDFMPWGRVALVGQRVRLAPVEVLCPADLAWWSETGTGCARIFDPLQFPGCPRNGKRVQRRVIMPLPAPSSAGGKATRQGASHQRQLASPETGLDTWAGKSRVAT